MGFSLSHLIAQPVGWGLRGAGAVQNILPGQGDSSLNQIGRAITDPNATLSNPGGLFNSANAFTDPTQSPRVSTSVAQVDTRGTNPTPQSPSPSGSVGGGTQALTPAQVDYYNQLYNTRLSGLRGQLGQLGQQRDVNSLQLQQQYQNSANMLDTQHAQGMRNLDFSGQQLQQSRAQSLNDIAKQVESMGMSYNNQLGSLGAGNSSAAMLINQALAGQAARNRAGVVQDASSQQQALDMQRSDLEQNFTTQRQQLDQWKQGKVAELLNSYNDNYRALQEAIAGAQGEQAQVLAQYQPQLIQQAIDALGNLQTVYNNTSQNLVRQYEGAANQNFGINPSLQEFKVNPVDAGRIGQVPGASPIQNQAFDPVEAILRRRDENGNPIVPIGG